MQILFERSRSILYFFSEILMIIELISLSLYKIERNRDKLKDETRRERET